MRPVSRPPSGPGGEITRKPPKCATIKLVHSAFGTVLWIVCIAGAVFAVVGLISARKTWDDFGKDGLLLDSEMIRGCSIAR